jgi:uncharacterized protein YdeI (YjbR/CyaY-like superfamily)
MKAPLFFSEPSEFRAWLAENHQSEKELLVGFYKVDSGRKSMTWPQSVDEALCFGWIDGVRRSLGGDSYSIRFSPRKPGSNWSAVNIKKMEKLLAQGLVQPAGIAAYGFREEKRSGVYSFENVTKELASDLETRFRANPKAWDFFTRQAPSYRKAIIHWIMTAKQEKTKLSRLEQAIRESENQQRLGDRYRKK